jgi:hypothetical protein
VLNYILSTNKISSSWTSYKIIPIPKSNSITAFYSIDLSSTLRKPFENILKTRLDWWLKYYSILPPDLFAFRKGMGTMECLFTFIGNIYHSFNVKECFVVIFVDICGAFDSVHIPTLVSNFPPLVYLLPSVILFSPCFLIRVYLLLPLLVHNAHILLLPVYHKEAALVRLSLIFI